MQPTSDYIQRLEQRRKRGMINKLARSCGSRKIRRIPFCLRYSPLGLWYLRWRLSMAESVRPASRKSPLYQEGI